MEQIVRFKKIKGRTVLLFSCFDFHEDNSFLTRTRVFDHDTDFFIATKISEYITQIKPKIPYDIFIETNKPNEADILTIRYFAGRDIKDVVRAIDSKTFVIDDKLPIEYQIPTEKYPNGSLEKAKGRVNDILKYKGLDHLPKPLEQVRYHGDCYTKIELLDDCKYNLFKLKKNIVNVW